MKYEIVMRDLSSDTKEINIVTASFLDSFMVGDLAYVQRCLAQCVFRILHNGFKIVEYSYCNRNGQVMLCGIRVENGQSYSIRKAIKQEKLNVKKR